MVAHFIHNKSNNKETPLDKFRNSLPRDRDREMFDDLISVREPEDSDEDLIKMMKEMMSI